MSEESTKTTPSTHKHQLKEVKYSLKELLIEADEERMSSSLAKQIIDQSEIKKAVQDHLKRVAHARRKRRQQ